MRARAVVLLPCLLALACGVKRAPDQPADPPGFVETGVASWYGGKFHGRRTASGEVYDMYGLTAAHRTLPFGTVVRVTHLENRRSVEVRITDRGPFIKGRVIDLSYAAAKRLDMIREGVARVKLVVVRRAQVAERAQPVLLARGKRHRR
jgi:rare lipoprotein A